MLLLVLIELLARLHLSWLVAHMDYVEVFLLYVCVLHEAARALILLQPNATLKNLLFFALILSNLCLIAQLLITY